MRPTHAGCAALLMLGLTGCPYIFGPPDLSNVGGDSAVDTGTVPLPTTPTGTPGTTTNPNAPTLTEVTASPLYDAVKLAFRVDDPNGDLTGATVTVDRGGTVLQYVVPADLDLWAQFDVSELSVPTATPCGGYAEAWEVSIADAAGNPSAPVPVAATVTSAGTLPAGDTDLDTAVLPLTACGEIVQVDPKQEDRVFFSVTDDRQATFELRWADPTTDLDLYIFAGDRELGHSRGDNPEPELVSVPLEAGVVYRIEVRYWAGPASTYQLFVR